MSIVVEELDCIGNVSEIDVHHYADDLMQAWDIIHQLRPGSIHSMEVDLLCVDKGSRAMFPKFSPYVDDANEISRVFPAYCSERPQSEELRTVSGSIKEILIEKTKDNNDIAIIQLAERDDFGLIIFPDLFETYKSEILRGDHIEYCGIPQQCHINGRYGEIMIFVTSINSSFALKEPL